MKRIQQRRGSLRAPTRSRPDRGHEGASGGSRLLRREEVGAGVEGAAKGRRQSKPRAKQLTTSPPSEASLYTR